MVSVLLIEAVLVGIAARRGKSVILAGAVVWTIAAVTLVLFPAVSGYISGGSLVVPLALQRMLSGMSAVVLADFVSQAIATRWAAASQRPNERRGLRKYSFHAFVLVALVPALLISTASVLIIGAKQETEGRARLHDAAGVLSDHIEEYLSTHARAMEAIAATADRVAGSPIERRVLLEQYASIYSGFTILRLTDADGAVHTFVPPRVDGPVLSVSDRQLFKDAIRVQHVVISDVVMGQVDPVPMVFVAAPLSSTGGVAFAGLDLSKFRQFVEQYQAIAGSTVVILDRHDRAIYASPGSRYTVRQDLSGDELVRAGRRSPDGLYEYTPQAVKTPLATGVVGAAAIAVAGWTVFVEQPRLGMRLQSNRY